MRRYGLIISPILLSVLLGGNVLQGAETAPAAPGNTIPTPIPPEAYPGYKPWMAGDPELALKAVTEGLAGTFVSTEATTTNLYTLLTYLGQYAAAEKHLETLIKASGPSAAKDAELLFLKADLLAKRGDPLARKAMEAFAAAKSENPRSWFAAGLFFLKADAFTMAKNCFLKSVENDDDSFQAWLYLGDAEAALGLRTKAVEAWTEASKRYPGGDVLLRLAKDQLNQKNRDAGIALLRRALASLEGEALRAEIQALEPGLAVEPRLAFSGQSPTLRPGEKLVYLVKYLFFRVGTLTVENLGRVRSQERWAHRIRFTVKSNPLFSMLKINSKFESLIAEEGMMSLRQESLTEDSTTGRYALVYEMDPVQGSCVYRSCVEGLFDFDRLTLPPLAQDGVSVFQLAREAARRRDAFSVLTAVDGDWKGTDMKTMGEETLRWNGKKVPCTIMEAFAHYDGPGGLSGRVTGWFSSDGRAIPYKSKMKISVGSVVFDLLPESILDP